MPKKKTNLPEENKGSSFESNNPVAKRRAIEAKFRRIQEKRVRKSRVWEKKKEEIEKIKSDKDGEKKEEKRSLENGETLPIEEAPPPKPLTPADPGIASPPNPIKPASDVSKEKSPFIPFDQLESIPEDKDNKKLIEERPKEGLEESENKISENTRNTSSVGRSSGKIKKIQTQSSRTSLSNRKNKKKPKKTAKKKESRTYVLGLRQRLNLWQRDLKDFYDKQQEKRSSREAKQNKEALAKARERIDPSLAKSTSKQQKKGTTLNKVSQAFLDSSLYRSAREVREKRLRQNLENVVGLDIGASSLKAVFFSREEEVVLAERLLPEGVILSRSLGDEDILKEEIKYLWKEAGIPSNRVNISISSELLTVRAIFLPAGDEEDIERALFLNSDTIISPMRAEDSVIDYKNLLRQGRELTLQIAAVDKLIAKSYVDVVKGAGLYPVALQGSTLPAAQTLIIPRSPNSSHALIDIGAETTKLLACSGPDTFYLKTIPIAGNHFTRAIAEETGLSWEDSEVLKKQDLEGVNDSLKSKAVRAKEVVADRLCQEILQAKKNYSLSDIGQMRPMTDCLFIGAGSQLSGLQDQIQFFAGFESKLDLRPATAMKDRESVVAFSTGLGLSIKQESSLLPEESGGFFQPRILPKVSAGKRSKIQVSRDSKRVSPLVLALLLSALFLTGGVLWSNSIKSSNQALSSGIALREKVLPESISRWSAVTKVARDDNASISSFTTQSRQQVILFNWRGSLEAFRELLSESGVGVQEITIIRNGREKRIRVVMS